MIAYDVHIRVTIAESPIPNEDKFCIVSRSFGDLKEDINSYFDFKYDGIDNIATYKVVSVCEARNVSLGDSVL